MGAGAPRFLSLEHKSSTGRLILGARHEWPREPFCCKPRACYLCGEDFESHPELLDHWRQKHLELPAERLEAMTDRRCEEEVRKRSPSKRSPSKKKEEKKEEVRNLDTTFRALASPEEEPELQSLDPLPMDWIRRTPELSTETFA